MLPGSPLTGSLRALGYEVGDLGDGERILATAITEQFTLAADGELELLTQRSTKPIAETRHHAGTVKMKRYTFGMPWRMFAGRFTKGSGLPICSYPLIGNGLF